MEKKKLKKLLLSSAAGILLFSAVAPSGLLYVQASELSQISEVDDIAVNEEEIVASIISEVSSTAVVQGNYNENARVGGALIAKLIAKYGLTYVKKTLPKIIYKKVAPIIGKKVSQAKFLSIWNNVINWGTGAAIEQGLAKVFKSMGMSSGVANTAASIIVTALSILI